MEQPFRPNARCRRCPSRDTVRLRKIRSYDNDVFRCPRCGLLFSPPNPSTRSLRPERREEAVHPASSPATPSTRSVRPAAEVEEPAPCPARGQASRLDNATKNPNLDSYANATSATTPGSPKRFPSYDAGRLPAPQTTPNRPQNCSSQLRHATTISKLNSYGHATNATTISYEKNVFSYDSGRTLADRPAPTSPFAAPDTDRR